MRTARTTVLLTDTERADLDAFAASRSESVSNVVRDATVRYMAQPAQRDEYEEALEMVLPELDAAFAKWNKQIDSMHVSLDKAIAAVDRALEGDVA